MDLPFVFIPSKLVTDVVNGFGAAGYQMKTSRLEMRFCSLFLLICCEATAHVLYTCSLKHFVALQVRSLQVTVEEAHRLVSRTTCRPYCTVSLNDVHVGRTKVKEGLQPLWSEEFMFE